VDLKIRITINQSINQSYFLTWPEATVNSCFETTEGRNS